MKKTLILSFLLASFAGLNAQTFQLGLKGGLNISNFTGGDFNTVSNEAIVGLHAGGLLRLRFGNVFAIQPELVFSNQGAKLEGTGGSYTARVSYLNVPILLQFHTGSGFFVEAGPQIGFKVSEDVPDQTIDNFAKSTDLSLALGLGYQTRSGFGVSGRYNIGVSKVGDFDSGNIDPDFRNGVIQLGVFFAFMNNRNRQ